MNTNLSGGSLTLIRQASAIPSAHGQLDVQNIGGVITFVDDQGNATGAVAAAALNSRGLFNGNVTTNFNIDVGAANGLVLKITNPATLGTATVFKGKAILMFGLSKA